MATSDAAIAGFARLAKAVHRHGARVLAQLFHPGREVMEGHDGSIPAAFAPSAVPNSRFHVMPSPMSRAMIGEIVTGYGEAARRFEAAGFDGVEIVASHGYLPAQFLNPSANLRDDDYGGSPERRLRFLKDVIAEIRRESSSSFITGLRISLDEQDDQGLKPDDTLACCRKLEEAGAGLDYYSVVAGSSFSLKSAIHIVPPMEIAHGYVAPFAAELKRAVAKPVIVAGRINQPQIAEAILAAGQADFCGMTRAMICDPDMPAKAMAGRLDDIRACIACNQACIGHFHRGYPISCIQYPETGRELSLGAAKAVRARRARRILVAGGGPAGMKAAAVLAERGHAVVLCEASSQLGGQALLAQLLPGRAEFGGIIGNLSREVELAGVELRRNTAVDRALVDAMGPDAVVIATGAVPRRPPIQVGESAHVVDAWQVLKGMVNPGQSVAIADWRADWIGLGLAEKLARQGSRVRLYVEGVMAGETLPWYVRDHAVGVLHKLGVEIVPYARLYGVDADTVYFSHAASGEPILAEGCETLVLAQGHESRAELDAALAGYAGEVRVIGDALSPRTAEEAVLEGLKTGVAL
jgi:2,4-dienoyl-CoA reductase-like NADH-dependent reductase (Old Yellow Enzyme family)